MKRFAAALIGLALSFPSPIRSQASRVDFDQGVDARLFLQQAGDRSSPGLPLILTPRKQFAAEVSGTLAIEPGKDLEPKISDPARVKTILKLIEDVYYGRPLQYPKDGTVFKNKEGLLPGQPSGYYREYTVMPPTGSPSSITVGDRQFKISPANGTRGAERLIIGGEREAFYSPDHYRTFILLTVIR